MAWRFAKDAREGPRTIHQGEALASAPVIAEHRSPLWLDGRADEFILRCGKVQNLRVAITGFRGIEVDAGQTLSFWAQVGRPSAGRGFAVGREIVNGCVVPTTGGGLCQLSNALAALAASAGARIVERHRHSALIQEQQLAELDATVAWNYVDLRIQADFRFRVEAELTQDELLLRMRAQRQPSRAITLQRMPQIQESRVVARGCLTCDETSCFRHQRQAHASAGLSAVLLSDRYPELATWLAGTPAAATWMVPWVRRRLRARAWKAPHGVAVETSLWPSLGRALRQRWSRGEGAARQQLRARAAADLAHDFARRLRPEHTDLVVTQELLVPLWRAGSLGGRAYDVYVHELPASELQRRLDAAAGARPGAASLRDFRVDPAWERDEWNALARARTLLTPHHEVCRVLTAKGLNVHRLPWDEPPLRPVALVSTSDRITLTLAGSALARKGALDVAAVAKRMDARVLILGSPPSDPDLWQGVDWRSPGYASDWIAQSDVVLLPAYVEHQPRALLRALAAGRPVVASAACGLGTRPGLIEVAPGEPDSLARAIEACLARPVVAAA